MQPSFMPHEDGLSRHHAVADLLFILIGDPPQCLFGIAFFYFDGDGLPEFEPVELKSRPVVRLEKKLETPEDVNDVMGKIEDEFARVFDYADANKLPEEICTPIFHFTYSHNIADEVRRIENFLDGRAHLFWKEIPTMTADDVYSEEFKAGDAATMADMLRDEVDDEKVRNLSERLLASPNIVEELVRWQKEQLTNESS